VEWSGWKEKGHQAGKDGRVDAEIRERERESALGDRTAISPVFRHGVLNGMKKHIACVPVIRLETTFEVRGEGTA
jgi:hypothetical protein